MRTRALLATGLAVAAASAGAPAPASAASCALAGSRTVRSTPFARVIVKAKDDTQGDLKDVPLMTQYLKTDEARQVQAMAMAPQAIGFNYAAPPGTPPTRLKALRNGLMQAWNDPDYQAEATKAQLVPYPQDYQTVQRLVAEVLSASPEALQKARDVLGIQ